MRCCRLLMILPHDLGSMAVARQTATEVNFRLLAASRATSLSLLAGITAAKAAGRYKGRAPTARDKTGEIRRLAGEGTSKAEIARRLGVGERSVYRMLGTG